MPYKVVNSKGKKMLLGDFKTKKEAQESIVHSIRGTATNKIALSYYLNFKVRKV